MTEWIRPLKTLLKSQYYDRIVGKFYYELLRPGLIKGCVLFGSDLVTKKHYYKLHNFLLSQAETG